jgi:hypothetical protein
MPYAGSPTGDVDVVPPTRAWDAFANDLPDSIFTTMSEIHRSATTASAGTV